MVEKLVIKSIDCEDLIGTHLNEDHYDTLIESDCDMYSLDSFDESKTDESNIIFKFRKNVFSDDVVNAAYEAFKNAAIITENRGSATGPRTPEGMGNHREWVDDRQFEVLSTFSKHQVSLVDETPSDLLEKINSKYSESNFSLKKGSMQNNGSINRGVVWLVKTTSDIGWHFSDWEKDIPNKSFEQLKEETQWILDTKISHTNYANRVKSGVVGSMDRFPRLPYCRQTTYTRDNPERVKKGYPFIQELAKMFEELLPERYAAQKSECSKVDDFFIIPETPFTTITVNKNFRTAAHRDAGDLSKGFSNLLVISNGKEYEGGYLVLPEYRVAVDVQPGDLLLINNHEGIHGNTEFSGEEGYERMSLVCYFRENMVECGQEKYERIRYEFCHKYLKLMTDHPNWKQNWSGTYPGMWTDKVWYDYLREQGGQDMLDEYHPEQKQKSSLEDFF